MLSEKLLRILKAKSPFTDTQLASMTEAEGWRWVYGQGKRADDVLLEVCFTGFSIDEKAELAALASRAGMVVVRSVTKKLAFLVAGSSPGPSKLAKAQGQGALILDRRQFEHMLATGEVPEGRKAA